MRFLGIGETCDLGDMYFRLATAGHEVKVFIQSSEAQDIYSGMLEAVSDWKIALPWVKEAGENGIIIFEGVGSGNIQDELRQDGYQVIGGSAYGDRLESDRAYGQRVFAQMGLQTCDSHHFTDYDDAIEFLRTHPARYVFKLNGAFALRTLNYVGMLEDGSDILALLMVYRKQEHQTVDFVLMDYIDGIEVGIGAYFNGETFLQPACLDWEHKRFFPGSQGELTGEMGTVVTYRGAEIIFEKTLARIENDLKQSGYCGYININLIANEDGLWPLEFTSRFGYPGFAICEALHLETWESIFKKLLHKSSEELLTSDGFATGVVLTVPPFPYTHGYSQISKGLPILFRDSMTDEDYTHLHLAEVALSNDQLITSGTIGYIGVAIGVGINIEDSRTQAYALANKVIVPNLRYRNDIGDRVINGDYARLKTLGYIAE
ncbi:MAG TPA: phosphoribosylamine--glycine ligase [Methylotenera sp.]|nr:phosphoribosylamine--glycine ligase [Methylotenera sp.]